VLLLTNKRLITNMYVQRRRRALLCAMVVVSVLVLCVVCLTGALFGYRYLKMNTKKYMECTLMYDDEYDVPQDFKFEETVEMEQTAVGTYEKLEVPPILNFFRATVVHDFNQNQTAIIDRDHKRCYTMPLNPETVKPPSDLLDLFNKLQSGYYMPDARLVRQNYAVMLPALDNLDSLAPDVQFACLKFHTYRLVPIAPAVDGAPKRQKKSVGQAGHCDMLGDGFCLGQTPSTNTLECIKLVDCI